MGYKKDLTRHVSTRISPDDYNRLSSTAERLGIGISIYIRSILHQKANAVRRK